MFTEKRKLKYFIKVYDSSFSYSLTSKYAIAISAITPPMRVIIYKLAKSV